MLNWIAHMTFNGNWITDLDGRIHLKVKETQRVQMKTFEIRRLKWKDPLNLGVKSGLWSKFYTKKTEYKLNFCIYNFIPV